MLAGCRSEQAGGAAWSRAFDVSGLQQKQTSIDRSMRCWQGCRRRRLLFGPNRQHGGCSVQHVPASVCGSQA